MKYRAAFMSVSPYLGAIGAVVLLAMLLGTIYFPRLELRWVPFIAGILVASILALVSRTSRAELTILRRTAQLCSAREKLAKEIILRARAEEALCLVKTHVHYLDQEMPAMLTHVDAEQRYRYHNCAFRAFMGLRSENIDGRNLREVLGAATYAKIEDGAEQALSVRTVLFERTQPAAGNTVFRLSTQFLPHFGDGAEGTRLLRSANRHYGVERHSCRNSRFDTWRGGTKPRAESTRQRDRRGTQRLGRSGSSYSGRTRQR